jgi:hypothetical protein
LFYNLETGCMCKTGYAIFFGLRFTQVQIDPTSRT